MKELNLLPGFIATDGEAVSIMGAAALVARAVALLKANEPPEGYYLAFSGGKDSCAIKALAILAGVKFEAWYNQTTIDSPELVKFIKQHHADVQWNRPPMNMMTMVATINKTPPTRRGRWCCEVFKEGGGGGRVKIMGVRKEESPRRAKNWTEVANDMHGDKTICPVVFWSTEQIWDFLHSYEIAYCPLYDERGPNGEVIWDRMGCVDCPIASDTKRKKERERWPRMAENWKKAVIANWQKWHAVPREDGAPRYHAKFKTGEDFYQWWITAKAPDYMREDCQGGILWTNEPGEEDK